MYFSQLFSHASERQGFPQRGHEAHGKPSGGQFSAKSGRQLRAVWRMSVRRRGRMNNYCVSSIFLSIYSRAFFMFTINASSGIRAIPCSSVRTMTRCPPVSPNRSRAPFGMTIWPLSLIATEPQIFFPLGGGGMIPTPSTGSVRIRLSMVVGESRGCSRAAEPVCGFSRGTTARSVSLSWRAREVGSPCEWRGGARHCSRAMVGECGLETC